MNFKVFKTSVAALRLYSPRCTYSNYLIATMDAGKDEVEWAQAWADGAIAAREKNLRTDRKPGVEGKEEGVYQFKPGDKVVLKPKEELYRPEWKYQEIGVGTVRTDTTPLPLTTDSWITIQWADGSRNEYFARDVLLVWEGEPALALADERAVAILHADGYSFDSRNGWNSQTCPAPACSPHILGPKEGVHIVYHGMNSGCGEESKGKAVDCCIAVTEDGSLKFGDGHKVGECPFLIYESKPKVRKFPLGTIFKNKSGRKAILAQTSAEFYNFIDLLEGNHWFCGWVGDKKDHLVEVPDEEIHQETHNWQPEGMEGGE